MNITVNPVRNYGVSQYNNRPAFKGFDEKGNIVYSLDEMHKREDLALRNGCGLGAIMSCLAGLILAVAIGYVQDNDKKEAGSKFAQKVDSLVKSDDIKKDTFMMKDMNDDKVPDFVLTKKDGTQVVIDPAKLRLFEAVDSTYLNPIK